MFWKKKQVEEKELYTYCFGHGQQVAEGFRITEKNDLIFYRDGRKIHVLPSGYWKWVKEVE